MSLIVWRLAIKLVVARAAADFRSRPGYAAAVPVRSKFGRGAVFGVAEISIQAKR